MLSVAKTRQIWKTAFLPILDFLALLVGAAIIYVVRYQWFDASETLFGITFGAKKIYGFEYLQASLILALLTVCVYSLLGLYQINQKQPLWQTIFKLILGIGIVLLSLITFLFFNEYNKETLPNGVTISRFILGTGGFLALYFLLLGRSLFWMLEQILYRFGIWQSDVAIIGENYKKLIKEIKNRPEIAKILTYSELNQTNFDYLQKLIEQRNLSEIYLFSSNNPLENQLAELAERYKVGFIFSPEGFGKYESFGLKTVQIAGQHFFELTHSNLDGWQIVIKRIFDLVFALSFLVIFSWLYLLIAILIKLDSPGSIFYLSERVGPDGKIFRMWKFRRFKAEYCTSEINPAAKKALEFELNLIKQQGEAANRGALYKIKNDPRMTKMGRFLEKTSLDELPQFINVLIGSLSIVGPRPHQPREVAKYAKHHFKVLNIKPGITGLAQVNGRSDLNFEEEVKFDTYYVEKWSFWLDLWIIIRTPIVLFFKRHKS